MKIINLTSHSLDIADAEGNIYLSIPPSGIVARVAERDAVEPVTSWETEGGPVLIGPPSSPVVEGLPPRQSGVRYVVSFATAAAIKACWPLSRKDILVPGTGPGDNCLRDERGQIKAIRMFRQV